MAIAPKFLPQLLTYEDEAAKRILRNLKKIEIKNEYQLVDLGVKEYVSLPKLDQKAFRYVEKNGKLYLRESVYSVGGLVQDSVLINLGEFTIGDDETGEGLAYLARVKDAKAKQRARQLRECERIALNTINQINKRVKNAELLNQWQEQLKEVKMFVRLGKEDYYQSQVDIISKLAPQDETLAKIIVDYQTKINDKNQKWLTQPLKLPKTAAAERIGTQARAGIGVINPQRRDEFAKYYAVRQSQMHDYVHSTEEVAGELPMPPEIIYEKPAVTPQQEKPAPTVQRQAQRAKLRESQIVTGVYKLKNAFTKTDDAVERSRWSWKYVISVRYAFWP